MKNELQELQKIHGDIFTVDITNKTGKSLTSYIKNGNVKKKKEIFASVGDDNYFDLAEDYIKENFVGGDNIIEDDEALFSICTQFKDLFSFDAAKLIKVPKDLDAGFGIESGDFKAYFKIDVAVKKKLFKLVTRGITDGFVLGEIIIHEAFVSGDDLTIDENIFASASLLASKQADLDDVVIKKN